jgi:hypothetical protein
VLPWGRGWMTLKYDYRKILFYLHTLERNLLGENVNEMKLFSNVTAKGSLDFLIFLTF